jgi:hypothetical protein
MYSFLKQSFILFSSLLFRPYSELIAISLSRNETLHLLPFFLFSFYISWIVPIFVRRFSRHLSRLFMYSSTHLLLEELWPLVVEMIRSIGILYRTAGYVITYPTDYSITLIRCDAVWSGLAMKFWRIPKMDLGPNMHNGIPWWVILISPCTIK